MDLLKPLIALLAIVNPIGVVPFYLAFTTGMTSAQRLRTRRVASVSAFLVVAISGLFELRPLLKTAMNATLRLTPETARAESERWGKIIQAAGVKLD